jgi:hypothetical protein
MAGTILVSIVSLVIVNLFTMLCFREDKQRAAPANGVFPKPTCLASR